MPGEVDPRKQRKFAVEVVRVLRQAGYEAYWAGGCVRDELLGITPKDYDVATNARPEVGVRRVARILMSVVFPAPLGPKSPKSSPGKISRLTRSRARISLLPSRASRLRNRKIRVSSSVLTAHSSGLMDF